MDTTGLGLILLTTAVFSIIGIIYTRKKHISIEDYLTARNSIKLGVLVATLVASAIGSWILFSPPEVGVRAGIIGLIGYALGSASAVWVFAWLGVRIRKLMPSGHTLTEYVLHRFGAGMYVMVLLIMVFYMGVYLTAELTGIAQAADMVFGIPLIITALIVGVGTLSYTAAGGMRASIFTDWVQYWFMLPLIALVLLASVFFLGGFNASISNAEHLAPQLFGLGYIPGIEYGISLIIAIIGAELFNQGNWQRVYAAKTDKEMGRSFIIAGAIIIPIILAVGVFGLFAVGYGTAENPSVALFAFMLKITPKWILFTAMVLGVILVMSTIDTLLNGLVCLFTVDIVRLMPGLKHTKIMSVARWITVAIALIAVIISMKGYSVLYLFLIADLVCAAAAFPTFYGMYSRKFTGSSAIITTIIGIVAGAFLFPDPSFSRGNLLWSFVIAFIVPAILSPIFALFGRKFDFKRLKQRVVPIE